MKTEEFLVLHYDNFSQRAASLYQDLNSSPSLIELVLNDPTGVIADRILVGYQKPSQTRINRANRMLFSLLSNAQFIRWSKQFQERIEAQLEEAAKSADPSEAMKLLIVRLDKGKLYREIAEAAVQFCDVETMFSLIALGSDQSGYSASIMNPYLAEMEDGGNVWAVPVAIVFVLILILAIAGFSAGFKPFAISRQDLLRISTHLTEQLTTRAMEDRKMGKLTSYENL